MYAIILGSRTFTCGSKARLTSHFAVLGKSFTSYLLSNFQSFSQNSQITVPSFLPSSLSWWMNSRVLLRIITDVTSPWFLVDSESLILWSAIIARTSKVFNTSFVSRLLLVSPAEFSFTHFRKTFQTSVISFSERFWNVCLISGVCFTKNWKY